MADKQEGDTVESTNSQKRSGLATSSLVWGIISLLCFFMPLIGLLAGLAALLLGVFARRALDRNQNIKGKGMASAGYVMGIIGTVLGVIVLMIAIPNYLHMGSRSYDITTFNNMYTVRDEIERFADSTKSGYPTVKNGTNPYSCPLSDVLPVIKDHELQNPYSHETVEITLMSRSAVFPDSYEEVGIPPGDIRVYSNGKEYRILAGGRDGKAMSRRLRPLK